MREILLKILQSRKLEDLCEYLDSSGDLFDLGHIDSEEEQKVLDSLTETTALTLWAIHRYANKNDEDMKYTFDKFVESLEGKTD